METTNKQFDNTEAIIIGIGVTCLVGGVSIIFNDDILPKIFGVLLIVLSFIMIALLAVIEVMKRNKNINEFKDYIKKLNDQILGNIQVSFIEFYKKSELIHKEFAERTESTLKEYNLKNDSVFIKEGFIGLQRQINQIELDGSIDKTHDRLAILGHLPSYMRQNNLTREMGNVLYSNWQPPHLIEEYVRLVNQRKEAFTNFIENGGKAQDIFSKQAIKEYVINGCTFHDNIEDPVEEIEERLNALLYFISKPNYYICLWDEQKKTPNYILKQGIGLVIDTRTAEITSHFTDSIDGIYTESDIILDEFEKKFRSSWQPKKANKDEIKKFLRSLLAQVKDFKVERDKKN